MYHVFDIDEDGNMSKTDLVEGLTMLYHGATIDQDLLERMADKIMLECEAYESEYINFEGIFLNMFNQFLEFQIAMQDSDIEKNCTIYF